ncbi:BON domain-containing protein [Pseudomonas plecoglossicida]|jgi:osmotically-inducible protein OsmY|uniref:BON domain-containing protein n=3 Tax=Pseudomonas putida TaxID=303 RepID=A0A1Y5KST8_PSEPU|nr:MULTISPECIES: BON domain-containing protein [Pseudomonas]AFO51390.1 transport-associated protein [Pseudomonas putida DOT-T1E]AYN10857.1 BON domain-containing protein [Pseudomonas putida]EKT4503690.1 BON domain-containing protein [Pseudomonas putida]EKT4568560.1 BON domain-containing protein [Pseudomonas putida]ELS0927925.1 BON domain-containing protein [Pseudomonas putida]
MNDLDLRDLVLEELEFKPDINAASIGVTVQNGVVTLSGHVNSYAQKVSAERTVKAMKGVRGLAEEIEVRLNKLEGTADDTIASRALNIIAWSSDANVEGIQVTVQKGTVTLEGQLDWQYQKEVIEQAVLRLSGVVGVHNRITLKARADVVDIKRHIEDALKRSAEIEAEGIRVTVDGGVVKLEGKVHLLREREVVERAAWSVPGVSKVEDYLLIA